MRRYSDSMNTRINTLMICLSLAVLIGFLASLSVGPVGIGTWAVLSSIFSGGSDVAVIIAQEIRLPRALLGAAIGATLGISGAAMQGYVRNPTR